MRRIIELPLLLAVVMGGVLAWQSGRERARLEGTHDRLSREVGNLPIGDPTKVLIRAVETGEPLHFAWQVHLPPNYALAVMNSGSGFSGSPSAKSRDFVARVRFREDDEGRLQVGVNFGGNSSRVSLGDRSLADLLRGRWDEILVDRPGVADTAVIEPDRSAVLVRLTLPEGFGEKAGKKPSPHSGVGDDHSFFNLMLNPNAPKP